MRQISCDDITRLVSKLCIHANIFIPDDIKNALEQSLQTEKSEQGKTILGDLLENISIAACKELPICQDTGMAVIFVEIGQEVHVFDGSISEAITKGVSDGYTNGFLRASVVSDPILRVNTKDNTPPIIHYEIVPGDTFKITVAPKGFGSENMSAMRMLNPSDGIEGVKSFILETVTKAGSNPCPPIIVGVGIGGTIEKTALIAKKSLLREIGQHNQLKHIADLEDEMLDKINQLGIGPGGLGGLTTALAINIEVFPTHIAGLPVVVNMSCHATRHAVGEL